MLPADTDQAQNHNAPKVRMDLWGFAFRLIVSNRSNGQSRT